MEARKTHDWPQTTDSLNVGAGVKPTPATTKSGALSALQHCLPTEWEGPGSLGTRPCQCHPDVSLPSLTLPT